MDHFSPYTGRHHDKPSGSKMIEGSFHSINQLPYHFGFTQKSVAPMAYLAARPLQCQAVITKVGLPAYSKAGK